MPYNDADHDLAIRTILGEEGTPDGQTGVAAVILNRLAAGSYGKSLGDVILAPNQFEPWSHPERTDELFKIPRDDPRYVRAARILDGVSSGTIPDPTGGATHFYAPGAQAALGRLPPNWASGGGQKLGQTMFYAPQGRVTRQPAKPPSDDPTMRSGLQQLGNERQLAAAREAPPDRPPAFMKGATRTNAAQSGQMANALRAEGERRDAPPDRPPKFMSEAKPATVSGQDGYLSTSLSEISRAPGEIWRAAREGAAQEKAGGAADVKEGVAAMRSGQPLQMLAGAAEDVRGTVRGLAAPLTGLAEGALYGLERTVDPQGLGLQPEGEIGAATAKPESARAGAEGRSAVEAALHEPTPPPDRPPSFMPDVKPVEAPPAQDLVTLYRFEPRVQVVGNAPDWVKETPAYKNTLEATGRWFSDDLDEAKWYANEHPDGHVVSVTLPRDQAEKYRVSKMASTGGKDTPENPAPFSRRPDKEFFLPKDIAAKKQPHVEAPKPMMRQKQVRPDEPLLAPDADRFYHGGANPTSGGGRWVSMDRDYAHGYAEHNSSNRDEVHYVDIPRNDPYLKSYQKWDEHDEKAGINNVGNYAHFELPEDRAKQLKRLIPEKPPTPKPPGDPRLTPHEQQSGMSFDEWQEHYKNYPVQDRLQRYVDALRQRFGIEHPISVVTSGEEKIPQATLGRATITHERGKTSTPLEAKIVTRLQYAPKRQAAVVTHEFGHHVQWSLFDVSDEATKAAIFDAWKRDTAQNPVGKKQIGEFYAEQAGAPLNEASDAFTKNLLKKYAPGSTVNTDQIVSYNKTFSEWFANQVSRFLTTDREAVTLADKFFKGIADFWRKLYETFTGKQGASAEVEAFLRQKGQFFEDTAARREGRNAVEGALRETPPDRPPAFMPDAVAATQREPQPLGAAASTAPKLPDRPPRETMWDWEDNFNRLRKSTDADRSEFTNYVKALPEEIRNPETMQKFFRRMEDPNHPFTPVEEAQFRQYVEPLKREELSQWEEAKKTDLDVADYDPTYAHRIVKGKAPELDRLTGYDPDNKFQIFGGGRSLPQSTSSMKERRFFAIQSETGERRVVARDDDGNLSVLSGGKFQPVSSNLKMKVGDAFKLDGQTWTMEQARAHEVTAAGGPEYYENALVATIDNIMKLRRVNRAVYELNRLKGSPEWAAYARPIAERAPAGWRESLMPVFRGYRLEPRLANVIDDFYGHREPGGLVDTLGKINRWAVGTMFWSPVAHGLNATSHWATARAWDWINPVAYARIGKTMSRAIFEVAGQGEKYQALLREGNGLLYSSVANQKFYEKMLKDLGETIVRQPSRWGALADAIGVPVAALPKMLYEGSSRALWYWSDMLMMQRVLELEDKGMTLRDAVQEAERHIPSYRTRSELLGSRAIAQATYSPAFTEFSRYHVDMLNSWGNIIKDVAKGGKDPLGHSRRVEALGALVTTGVVGMFIWPAIDAGYKKVFGPAAKFGVRGAQTLSYPLMDKAMQTRWAKEHLPRYVLDYYNGDADVVTTIINLYGLAPTTRLIAELSPITNFHDLFTGQNTIEPADIRAGRVGRVAGQAAEHIAEGTVQPYQVFERARQGGKDVLKSFAEQATGGSEPNRAGRQKVFTHQEKQAQRRAAHPKGFLESIFDRSPF